MGNSNDSGGPKPLLYGGLYELIRSHVEVCSGLIEDNDLLVTDDGPGKADELFLPH
jgi:hypothetical protein